ncbi:hypothetical protein ACP4OV_029430 [Aristida adscensionis]
MGNCSCLERARVVATWEEEDGSGGGDRGLPGKRSGGATGTADESDDDDDDGGTRVRIRMTKGQLRRLLESAGRRGATEEDVAAEIMSVGAVRVDAVAPYRPPPMLETIQEDDLDE